MAEPYPGQLRLEQGVLRGLMSTGPVGVAALYVAAKPDVPLIGSFHTDLPGSTRATGCFFPSRAEQPDVIEVCDTCTPQRRCPAVRRYCHVEYW